MFTSQFALLGLSLEYAFVLDHAITKNRDIVLSQKIYND